MAAYTFNDAMIIILSPCRSNSSQLGRGSRFQRYDSSLWSPGSGVGGSDDASFTSFSSRMLNVAYKNKAGMSGWPESRDQLSSSCFTILAAVSLPALLMLRRSEGGREVQSLAREQIYGHFGLVWPCELPGPSVWKIITELW